MTTPLSAISRPENTKLGPYIHSWSIPADETCPGASNLCRSRCYALRGYFRFPKSKLYFTRNYDFSQTDAFVPWFNSQLRGTPVSVLRIHVSGDFYDPAYTQKWHHIIAANPRVQFFAYTRSWRLEGCLGPLTRLAQLPNCCLWFSVDRETGPAPLVTGVRRAYMAINDVDAQSVPDDCDLVFRDHPETPLKKANGVLVCPTENGVPGRFRHTCTTCGICWNRAAVPHWEQLLPLLSSRQPTYEINVPDSSGIAT